MATPSNSISNKRFAELTTGHPGFAQSYYGETYGFTHDPHGWEDGFDLEAPADPRDPEGENYCEHCDQDVDYTNGYPGVCGCDI